MPAELETPLRHSEIAEPPAGLVFEVGQPAFDAATATARFPYRLGELSFTETLRFPTLPDPAAAATAAFRKLLDLTAMVLGVSYFKLLAPFHIAAPRIALTEMERALILDVYENGLE